MVLSAKTRHKWFYQNKLFVTIVTVFVTMVTVFVTMVTVRFQNVNHCGRMTGMILTVLCRRVYKYSTFTQEVK